MCCGGQKPLGFSRGNKNEIEPNNGRLNLTLLNLTLCYMLFNHLDNNLLHIYTGDILAQDDLQQC